MSYRRMRNSINWLNRFVIASVWNLDFQFYKQTILSPFYKITDLEPAVKQKKRHFSNLIMWKKMINYNSGNLFHKKQKINFENKFFSGSTLSHMHGIHPFPVFVDNWIFLFCFVSHHHSFHPFQFLIYDDFL